MHTVFDLPHYPVHVGDVALSLPHWLEQHPHSGITVLTDENTHTQCWPLFLEKTGLTSATVLTIPAGEGHKNLATCQQVWAAWLHTRLERQGLVINLGGGMVGDLGGFCAATWKRGVQVVQVPTTLLAMTDAAIGGKVGIDFQGVKNTIGAFHDPAAVFVDPDWLYTLPERELRSGLAEVMKHALIGDPELLEVIEDSQNLVQREDVPPAFWHHLLCASIAVKARIVAQDPQEQGLRRLLNYGHTIGHAVESYFLQTPFPLTHGEAVALGMICESWLARTHVPNGHNWLARTLGVLSRTFLHRPIPEQAFPEIWAFMQQDKKNTASQVLAAVPNGQPFGMALLVLDEEAVYNSLRFYNELE